MDLALHLGMTLDDLKKRLSEKEFLKWDRYSTRYMLPQRRLEVYLAQIAMWIAKTGMQGMEGAVVQDFLFDPPDFPMLPEDALKNDMEVLGFAPTKD